MGSAHVGRCLCRQALKWPAKSYPDKVVTVHQGALEFATIHSMLQVGMHLAFCTSAQGVVKLMW